MPWRRTGSIVLAVVLALLVLDASAADAQLRGVKATVTPLLASEGLHAGSEVRAALKVSLPQGFHVQSNKPRDPSLIPTTLAIDAPPGVRTIEVVFPKPIDLKQTGAEQPLAVFEREFTVGVRFALASTLGPGDFIVPAHLRYQACNDTTCFAPTTADAQWSFHVVPPGTATPPSHAETFSGIAFGHGEAPVQPPDRVTASGAAGAQGSAQPSGRGDASVGDAAQLDDFVVLATTGGYQGSADFLRFIHDAENGVKERGLFEGRGPLAILFIVFLGGLALNLTPCVLPMIPINLAIIGAGTQAGSRRRGFLLGGAYGAAMAVVYGVLGLFVILTAGTFGTINASPWFNLSIAILFVALALAMFDVITIDFSRYSSNVRIKDSSRGTFLVAFGMGAVAALLAGACVAPVVIQVVLFSSNLYARGTAIALALPFLLGVGMAFPWPVAGAGLAALPKPGVWMVRVKQVFGVLILATAAYYGYEAYGIFADRWVDRTAVTSSVEEKLKEGWHRTLTDGLDAARREQKPVLLDLWATWCKNCLTMDKTTLEDPAVKSALDGYVKIKFQAEDPDSRPTKTVMQRLDAVGLPTYAILKPKT